MQLGQFNLPQGLSVRPSTHGDSFFLEELYKSTREDLDLLDQEHEFIGALKEQQYLAQAEGYGKQFPNAMYFIIEHHRERVGRTIIDFGHNEIRLVDIILIKKARGQALGQSVIRSFMGCADQVKAPLTLSVLSSNDGAKNLYLKMGFVMDELQPPHELMTYYPKFNLNKLCN